MQITNLTSLTCILLAISFAAPALAVTWTQDSKTLTATTPAYTLRMDSRSGLPQELRIKDQPVLSFSAAGWWSLTFENGQILRSSDCSAALSRTGDILECAYHSPRATINLSLHFQQAGIDLRAQLHAADMPITRLTLPPAVRFQPAQLHNLYFPVELGRALKPSFFQTQSSDQAATWTTHPIVEEGARAVGIRPTSMRDYNEPPVNVTVTPEGQEWLGPAAASLAGWKVRCPRPPQGKPDVTLLDTSSGPLLSLERVGGGWGWFIRWGGVFNQEDQARVRLASIAAARALWDRSITSGETITAPADRLGKPRQQVMPHQVGIIEFEPGPAGQEWARALEPLGCTLLHLHRPAELLQALQDRTCWLIVNPSGELLPATVNNLQQVAAAIHSYLLNGGVWMHTGGAPFFNVLEPQQYLALNTSYPPAFSDFMHLDSSLGQVSLYGVQDPRQVFVPAHLYAGGTPEGGVLSRDWTTWVQPGKTWDSPLVRLSMGAPVRESLLEYGKSNGFTRPLSDKVKPAVLEKLKRSLLLKYNGGNLRDKAGAVSLLPQPMLVHVSDYLHGGFDKQYPDQLPPNPQQGTPEEFAALIRTIHDAGGLFMPYTNPTWWCDGPPGPTFVREGTAPLLKDRQGKPVREAYSANYGWSLCTFHPAALAAEANILDQFTHQYPCDVLFQDQIGARSPIYDFNPASPTPYAYNQGMINIAARDSQSLPLSTENGFDAVLNSETQLCGITWGLVPTEGGPEWRRRWQETYPSGTWQFAPLALWLAHDKVLFALHDLGQFVTNRETLAWVLALGYQLSLAVNVNGLQQVDNRQWLGWLSSLQNTLGPQLMGAPLQSWEEPAPGIYRARYGSLLVTANTTPRPFPLDPDTTLSAFGFYIYSTQPQAARPAALTPHQDGIRSRSTSKIKNTSTPTHSQPPVIAGWLDRYRGEDYPGGLAFVQHGANLSLYAPESAEVTLKGAARVRLEGKPLPSTPSARGLQVQLPPVHQWVEIPAAFKNLAPQDRPHPPHSIGVAAIPWMTYGWASTTSEQWIKGLRLAFPPSSKLTVQPLSSWDALKAALGNPEEYLAIINPYGEHFPAPGPGQSNAALSAIRDYCTHGGAWFETSAYSLYGAVYPLPNGGAGIDTLGPGGLEFLGYHLLDLGNTPPAVRLEVTPEGQQWLGPLFSQQVDGIPAVVNRPLSTDNGALVLVQGGGHGFLTGVQPGGWGWFWRFGGSDPSASLSIPLTAAVCQHLYTTPPPRILPTSDRRYLYSLEVDNTPYQPR